MIYKAKDGRIFDTEGECIVYEHKDMIREMVNNFKKEFPRSVEYSAIYRIGIIDMLTKLKKGCCQQIVKESAWRKDIKSKGTELIP